MPSIVAKGRGPISALLVAVAACLGCAEPAAERSARDEVVIALESAPIQLDPRIGTDQASSRIYEMVLDGLVVKDPQGNLIPALAESWEILDGGLRYRFQLREGVQFHDGREFTAEDVVWTFETILDGTVTTAKRGAFTQLDRVEAVEPLVVDFVMSEPFGAFLVNLDAYLGIVPAGTSPEQMNDHPVGTGPFQVAERSPDRVVLTSFPDAWEGPPGVDRIVVREVPDQTVRALELRKGSVDLVVNDVAPEAVASFREDDRFRVVESPGSAYAYLGINLRDPLLVDPRVRRALALAIDRQQIVDALWQGLGRVTETLMPFGHWARHDELPTIPYDPEAARRLLDEAGYEDPDGDGPSTRFALTYKTSTQETALLQAQIIQAMLAAVGVELEIRSYEFATFYNDVKQGNFQLFSLFRVGILDPDIYSLILHSKSVPPNGHNRGFYLNPAFDALVDQGAALVVPADRRPIYLQAQELFAEDLPYISLFIRSNYAIVAAELEGYENYLSGEFYSLRRVRWRTDS